MIITFGLLRQFTLFFLLITGIAMIANGMSLSYTNGIAESICKETGCSFVDSYFWFFNTTFGYLFCIIYFYFTEIKDWSYGGDKNSK